MKSHLLLLQCVLESMGTRCCTSTTRDFKTLTGRVEHEGFSYLTITLPQFGKDLERALAQEVVTKDLFVGYSKRGCLPRFLSGFTSLVFDRASGRLLEEPSVAAIQAVRQVTNLFGKMDLPCSDARVGAAIAKYLECEKDIKAVDQTLQDPLIRDLKRIFELLFGRTVLAPLDREVFEGDTILPKHGPGATADRLRGNAKWNQREWTARLDEVFHHSEHLYPSFSHFLEGEGGPVDVLEPGAERPVRVITVPKTLKTPRIIAIEPTCMQYMQQALWLRLRELLETSDTVSSFIGFERQEPNQLMAQEGSLTGALATLDLSEASDRVSNQLVRALFAHYTWLAKGLDATRSRKADVPGHGVIRLAKYASMGSALCFPIEAMVFTAIVFLGIERAHKRPLSSRALRGFRGRVRVYGDDIIVPVDCAESVVTTLEAFGLRVNLSKSFWTGKFRESCGKEYYAGKDVSVVRVRRTLPTQRRHVPEIVSAVSYRNQHAAAYGEDGATDTLDALIERLIPFPRVLPTSQGLGKHSLIGDYDVESECPNLQRPLVTAAVVVSRIPRSNLEGYGALLKVFLKRGDQPFDDERHLERAGRPDAVDIKLRKVCPY